MNPRTESFLISLKLTPDQHQWLENTSRFIENETGCQVAMSSIILRLMEKGLPAFEEELLDLRARANSGVKRFPKLQLVLNK
jgi:hypothetical protein